jgi:hypothetical protein
MALEDRIDYFKNLLYMMLEETNYCLLDKRVICLSKVLDNLIIERQEILNSYMEVAS